MHASTINYTAEREAVSHSQTQTWCEESTLRSDIIMHLELHTVTTVLQIAAVLCGKVSHIYRCSTYNTFSLTLRVLSQQWLKRA